jgi:hypothetical protein
MNVSEFLAIPPAEIQSAVEKMSDIEKHDMMSKLAHVAARAAEYHAYVGERYGYGCGDQGHKSAVKEMNKVGKKVWCNAMGFNAYIPLNI